jgi:nucleoside-diphosphate-sugar epimerase
MRILLTGAGGYLGSAIARALRNERHEVIGLTRVTSVMVPLDSVVIVDLTDEAAVGSLLTASRPEIVVHAAGRVAGTALELYRDNTVATAVLSDSVLKRAPWAILTVLGSAAEYGSPLSNDPISEESSCRPISFYGESKLAASEYLLRARGRGLRCNLVRPFNLVGVENSAHQVVGAFIEKVRRARKLNDTGPICMGGLGAVRDFIATDDLVRLLINLVRDQTVGETVNACSGIGRPVRELIGFLAARAQPPIVFTEPPEATSSSVSEDIVVGNPARFLRLAELSTTTSLEPILSAAMESALGTVSGFDVTGRV